MFKCKISLSDITYGPKTADLDPLVALTYAKELRDNGYRKTSNAYCHVSRIDRKDWLRVMARERHCSIADFYNVDGSGIGDNHEDYYCRVHSKDTLTVHPEIIRAFSKV